MTNQGKNGDGDEKNWENEFDLWILHIKIRSCGNFLENLRKKMKWKKSYLTISLFNFDCLPNEDLKKVDTKNKDQDGKI